MFHKFILPIYSFKPVFGYVLLLSFLLKMINRLTNSLNPDETSHLDLNCLQRYLYRSTELNGLITHM